MLITDKQLINEIVNVAQKQRNASRNFKRPRIQTIQKYEDAYYHKLKPGLKGRFNFPIPILSGYLDTLLAKTDDPPQIKYTAGNNIAFNIAAKKINSAWEEDSSPDNGNWPRIDRNVKRLAGFSGVGVYELYAESEPKYRSVLNSVDYYDWHCEPGGGSDIDNHLFCGKDNVYFTKEEIVNNVKSGLFGLEAMQIARSVKDMKVAETDLALRNNRYTAMNLDQNFNNYVGQDIARLTRWQITYKGKRYYLLFDPDTLAVARCELLKDVFDSDLYSFVMWQTHEDSALSWSKGPLDDIYPLHEMFRVNINYMLDNMNRRGYGMRAYDPSMFQDASQLNWRPDGLVRMIPGARPTEGIYNFETPDNSTITINVFEYLNNLFGEKTGITPGAQGASETEKVGIYYGNMQQVQDRIGLYNKCYKDAQIQLGKRYKHNLKQYMPESMAVKYMGGEGIEWDELVRDELDVNFSIDVVGANDEQTANDLSLKKRTDVVANIMRSPELMGEIRNKKAFVEETLRLADFKEDEIKRLFDGGDTNDIETISRAMLAIDMFARGKTPLQWRGATTGYIRYMINYATDKVPLKEQDLYNKIIAFAKSHMAIVEKNTLSNALRAQQFAPVGPAVPEAPITPSTPGLPAPAQNPVTPPIQ